MITLILIQFIMNYILTVSLLRVIKIENEDKRKGFTALLFILIAVGNYYIGRFQV
jgi:hypothetical protein